MIIENVIACAAIISAMLIFSLVPIFMGIAQKRKVIKPVELFPPRGSSPVDVLIGYYGRLANPHGIFNPLMLYWAERGFITIEEDCKRGLKLTKLKDIERPDSNDGFITATYELEKSLFEHLFSARTVFYTLASVDFSSFFGKIMKGCKEEAAKTADRKTKIFSILTNILPFAMLFAVTLAVGLSTGSPVAVAVLFPAVAMAFGKLTHTSDDLSKGTAIWYFMYPFLIAFGGIPFCATVYLMPWEAGVTLSAALIVALLILFVINKKIDSRKPARLQTYGRICGFKRFLLLAEVEKLEALVEENPEYFYEILPYCYILGITEKLKKKFDRIIMDGPSWYLGELRDTLIF